MAQTPRENWAEYLGLTASVISGMIATGFMGSWNVLPFVCWLAIAIVGAGIAGAIATPLWFRGMISGAISGAGVLEGYVSMSRFARA
jgi:hypothetical protein